MDDTEKYGPDAEEQVYEHDGRSTLIKRNPAIFGLMFRGQEELVNIGKLILIGEKSINIKRNLGLPLTSKRPNKLAKVLLNVKPSIKCKCGGKYNHKGECKGKGYFKDHIISHLNEEKFNMVKNLYSDKIKAKDIWRLLEGKISYQYVVKYCTIIRGYPKNKPKCRKSYGTKGGTRRFNEEQIRDIKMLLEKGNSAYSLSKKFNCSSSLITRIRNNQTYKQVI